MIAPTRPSPVQAGRAPLRHVLLSFVTTRLVVFIAAWAGASGLAKTYHKGLFTEFALMWDGAWYAEIAKHWYSAPGSSGANNLAYSPLLPLLSRLLGGLFAFLGIDAGDHDYGSLAIAGVLLSNISLLAALYVLWHLVVLDHPASVANWTVWLLASFPLGVFWSAFYTESLFLLLAVSCVFMARKGYWFWAGILGGLATFTRWMGVLLLVVLIVEWLSARRSAKSLRADKERAIQTGLNVRPLVMITLVPLALLGYMLYLQLAFGSSLAMVQGHAQGWHEGLSFFPATYANGVSLLWQSITQTGLDRALVAAMGSGDTFYMWVDLGLPLAFAALGGLGWRRGWLRPSDIAWLGLALAFSLSWSTTVSVGRYVMPLWPTMVVGARFFCGRPLLGRVYLLLSIVFMGIGAYLFAGARWLG